MNSRIEKQQFYKQFTSNITLIVLCLALINIAEVSTVAETIGSNGKPIPKAATFHFAEYAYKETSKNVRIIDFQSI